MALNDLASPSMFALGGEMQGAKRSLLDAIPETKPMGVHLDAVQHDLGLVLTAQSGGVDPSVQRELTEQVSTFDSCVRIVHFGVEAAAEYASIKPRGDADEPARLLQLRDGLLQDGLATVQKSNLEKVGIGAAIKKAMTTAIKSRLKAIVIGDGATLLDVMKLLVKSAEEIGRILNLRAPTTRKGKAADGSTLNANDVRNAWIKVMTRIIQNTEMSLVPQSMKDELLGNVLAASEKAGARRDAKGKDGGEEKKDPNGGGGGGAPAEEKKDGEKK